MKKIAFIGLGHMGLPMAMNLHARGYEVIGYDSFEQARLAFQKLGGQSASCLTEAIQDCDLIITMLPSGKEVTEVYTAEEGIFKHAPKKSMLIECSTIDVKTAQDLHALARQSGFDMLDAPVSGGTKGAKLATLTFMVGGSAELFDKLRPVLAAMGKNIFHAGSAGLGQVAKMCNNMLLGISMIGVSEMFNLGKAYGIHPKTLFEISSHASGACWSLTQYCPEPDVIENVPANVNYEPGFMSKMMLKDLNLAAGAAGAKNLNLPLGEKAKDLYTELCAQGLETKDFSVILKWLQSKTK